MQTTAIGTVANSLPENEVILLTLLISKGYILFAELRKYILDVIEENRPAVNCYTKLGFTAFKKTKKKNGYTKLFMKLNMQDILC